MASTWIQVFTKPYSFSPDEPCMLEVLKFDAGHEKFSGIYKLMDVQRYKRPVWKLVAYLDGSRKLHPVTCKVSTFLAHEPSINSWAIFHPFAKFHALCASTCKPSPENVPEDGWIMHERKRDPPKRTGNEMMDLVAEVQADFSMAHPCDRAIVKSLEFSEIQRLENWDGSVDYMYWGDERLTATREDLAALGQPFPSLQKVKGMSLTPWFPVRLRDRGRGR